MGIDPVGLACAGVSVLCFGACGGVARQRDRRGYAGPSRERASEPGDVNTHKVPARGRATSTHNMLLNS